MNEIRKYTLARVMCDNLGHVVNRLGCVLIYSSMCFLAQLNEIRKYTLARVMCDNLDNVETIQKFVNIVPLSAAVKNMK